MMAAALTDLSLPAIAFYVFAGLAIAGGLTILLTRNVMYAAFSLIFTFLGVAAIYVLAGADFVAAVQIMVYVGGVLVILLFGVMLTNRLRGDKILTEHQNKLMGGVLAFGLLGLMLKVILSLPAQPAWADGSQGIGQSLSHIGVLLMTDYVLAFELAAILLLVALIGAAYLAQHAARKEDAP